MREGQRCERCAIADRELLIDMMQMDLDRAVGNIQLASDLLVRQPFGYQAHDLTLSFGKHREHIFGACVADGDILQAWGIGMCEWQQASASRDLPQALHQHMGRHLLEDHSICSSRSGDDQVTVFGGYSEKDDARRQMFRRRGSKNIEPGNTGHEDVEKCDVRRKITDGLDAFFSVIATCNDFEIVRPTQQTQSAQLLPRDGGPR